MPGNDNSEILHNFFEQDNSSQGYQSQAGGGGWPTLNNNQWVGIQRQNGPRLTFSTTNYTSQSTDSEHGNDMQRIPVPFSSNPSKKSELIRSQPLNQQLNLNGYMHGSQGLQAEFEADHAVSGHNLIQRGFSNFEPQRTSTPLYDSSGTRSSERPEATEAPINFDFLGGQQLMRSQHPGISQPHPVQPQRINDMQLWQQRLIYKQLQEKHRQQQLLQLHQGVTQHNLLSQLSNVARHGGSNQMPSILSGLPVSNAPNNMWSNEAGGSDQGLPSSSPMFLAGNVSWVQRSSRQGIPNEFMFSHDQGQTEGTTSFAPQQHGQSLFGTPVASTSCSLGHQSQFQGNFHQINHVYPSLQIQGISGTLHAKAVEQVGPSCGISNLDPTEEKLLLSTDDDGNQRTSFGLNSDRSPGGYQDNLMQTNDYFSSFPTLNSGSWSALMQEAVEASSSDAGLDEEWSGLSFHKTELSSGNSSAMQPDNDRKQQVSWDEENLQNASSLSSRPLPLFNDAASGSNCNAACGSNCNAMPIFLHPMNVSCQQNEGAVASHAFFQQSSKEASNKPFDQSHQRKQPVGGNIQIQTQTQTQFNNICCDVWAGQTSEQLANSAHSLDAELNSHKTHDSWAQQKEPLHSQPNGWSTQSLAPSGDKASNCYANKDQRQHVRENSMNRTVNMQTDQNGSVWKVAGSQVDRAAPSSAGGTKAVGGNANALMMHNENYCSGNLAILNSSNVNFNQGTNQQAVNRQHGDYGKHAVVNAFCQNKREEFATKHQNQLSGNPQTLDSSMNKPIQRSGESCAYKPENKHPDDVLSEGFVPSNSQPAQNTKGGDTAVESSLQVRNVTQSLVNSCLKSSGQSARGNMGPHRFQFHPMGNLEMNTEPMDSQNHTLHSQHPSRGLNQEHGYVVHAPFSGPALTNDPNTGKGHLSDLQRNTTSAAEEINYRGTLSGHSAAPAINGSTTESSQNIRTGLRSQNMLELLHKVDQSTATKPIEHVSSGQNTPSGRHEVETCEGSSSHLELSQSPSFQGFSLNLAPPSRRQSVSDQASPLPPSLQTSNGFSQRNRDAGLSEDQSRPPSSASGGSLPPSHEASQKESQGSISFLSGHQSRGGMHQGNSSAAASAYAQKRQQSQDGASSNQSSVPSMPPPSRLNSSSDTYPVSAGHSHAMVASSHLRSSGQHKPVVETRSLAHRPATSAVPQQGGISTRLHNVWMSIQSQQGLSGVPPQKIISNVLQSKNPFSNDGVSLKAPQKLDIHNKRKGESSPSEFGTSTSSHHFTDAEDRPAKDNFSQQMPPSDSVDDPKKRNASLGPVQESELKYHSDGNPKVSLSSKATSSRDTGAHGHPLGLPDAQKQNNYSLLQQMQAMKGEDSDPTQRPGKRFKGPDFNMDTSQVGLGQRYIYGQNTVLRETNATSQDTSLPSDIKMLSFSSRDSKENCANTSLQVISREVSSQNLLTHIQHNLQNHSQPQGKTSVIPFAGGGERSQVSPQMAPSWFDKYGNFNNGQPLTTRDGVSSFEKNAKASVQNYAIPKVCEGMVHHVVPEEKDRVNLLGSFQQSTPSTALLPNHSTSSRSHSQLEVVDNNMIMIPQKRKSATSELLPWHKEVAQGFRRLQSISIMEQKWAWATNRLIDKLEEEFDMIDYGLSMTRSRRRLIFTTQLMQQILPAVPSIFFNADAATAYESIIYEMANLILGDACSLTSSGSDSCAILDSDGMILGKHNILAREGFTHFSRIVEEVIGRSKKMENDFLRLDSRVSILDVRLECQDLERNSIMNRFAKFHGRAQSDAIKSSANSEAVPRRAYPQRHVTAHAMPRNLPENVICLSL